MDLDTKRLNRKIKEVKKIDGYSESDLITIDDAIQTCHKFIEQLYENRDILKRQKRMRIQGTL